MTETSLTVSISGHIPPSVERALRAYLRERGVEVRRREAPETIFVLPAPFYAFRSKFPLTRLLNEKGARNFFIFHHLDHRVDLHHLPSPLYIPTFRYTANLGGELRGIFLLLSNHPLASHLRAHRPRPPRLPTAEEVENALRRYWEANGFLPVKALAPVPESHRPLLLAGGFYPALRIPTPEEEAEVVVYLQKRWINYPTVSQSYITPSGEKVMVQVEKSRRVYAPRIFLKKGSDGEAEEVEE
jgi:hypothetical protein